MAKYSREQRDRAVDLYIKYEHSAADTIRELGYPSRGALWMWYKDRLEEERTGIPSGRGERYRRYTDEQKRVAVEHYCLCSLRCGRFRHYFWTVVAFILDGVVGCGIGHRCRLVS